MTTYTYSISEKFPNGLIPEHLRTEIDASSITIALVSINGAGDVLSLIFKADLSSDELATLEIVFANHDPSPSVNVPMPVSVSNTAFVTEKPQSIGDRVWAYSHDFCDRTTWYTASVRVVDEIMGSGDGQTNVFKLANEHIIDVTHGKITDEHMIVPSQTQGGTSYAIEVKINGSIYQERTFGETDGDYEVDYNSGQVTFFTPPSVGTSISASYFYSPEVAGRSTFCLIPPPTKNIILTDVYVQVSKDLVMTDSIETGIFVPDPQTGQYYLYPPSRTVWKRIRDMVNYCDSVTPIIPAGLGGEQRGLENDTMIFWIQYSSPVTLQGQYGIHLRFWTAHDRTFQGEFATVSCFGIYEDATS